MNPLLLLKFLPYIAGIAAIAGVGLFLRHEGFKSGAQSVQITLEKERVEWQTERANAAQAAASASEAYRAQEEIWREKVTKAESNGQAQTAIAIAARDAADRKSVSLQHTADLALNSLRRGTPEAPATAAECAAADSAARVFRDLFGRCDQVAGILAGYADSARVAGNVCVGASD